MTLIKSNSGLWPFAADLFSDDFWKNRFGNQEWSPAVNITHNDERYEIEVAAPGLKKEDFTVTQEHGILTISGTSREEHEESERNYTRKEFSTRSFSRAFTLPEDVREEDIIARYEEGILKLRLGRSEKKSASPKTVLVE